MSSEEKPANSGYKYFAFLSYSRNDSEAARWLQKRLEWFRFPVALVTREARPPHHRYIRPIYRDKTNLEVDHAHYWNNIQRALEESRFLIILCSPDSAQSGPVDKEVRHFLETHQQQATLLAPVILRGKVTSEVPAQVSLCPALRELGEVLTNRNLSTMIPDGGATQRDGREQGFIGLVSFLLNINPSAVSDHIRAEELQQAQERAKVLKRWLVLVAVIGMVAVLAGIAAYRNGVEAKLQRDAAEERRIEADNRKKEAEEQRAQAEARRIEAVDRKKEADEQRAEAEAQRNVAKKEQAEAEAQRALVSAERDKQGELLMAASRRDHDSAMRSVKDRHMGAGLSYLERALSYRPDNFVAMAASAGHMFGPDAQLFKARTTRGHDYGVKCLAFSTDGLWIAAGAYDHEVMRAPYGDFPKIPAQKMIDVFTGRDRSHLREEAFVHDAAFSADGRWLALARSQILPTWGDVFLASVEDDFHFQRRRILFDADVKSIAFSPDSKWIAAGSNDKTASVIEVETGTIVRKMSFADSVNSVDISPNGRWVAGGSSDKTVRVSELETGKELGKMTLEGGVARVRFSPDGRLLAAVGIDHTLRLAAAPTGKDVSHVQFGDYVRCFCFSPEGQFIAAGSNDRTVRLIVPATGQQKWTVDLGGPATDIAFSPDGRWLAVGSDDRTVRVLETGTGSAVSAMEFAGTVNSVKFSQDGRWLGVGDDGEKSSVRVFEAFKTGETADMVFDAGVTTVCLNFDGSLMAIATSDNALRVVHSRTGSEISRSAGTHRIVSLSFSRDNALLAVGTEDNAVQLIQSSTGEIVQRIEFGSPVEKVSFHPLWNLLAVWGKRDFTTIDQTIKVFDARTGKEVPIEIKKSLSLKVWSASPDGQWVRMTADRDAGVALRENDHVIDRPGTSEDMSHGHLSDVYKSLINFNTNGRWAAISQDEKFGKVGYVITEDIKTGDVVSRMDFGGTVRSMCFSRDGKWLAAGSDDGTARLWEAASGRGLCQFHFKASVNSVNFSADGSWFAAGSEDKTVKVANTAWFRESDKSVWEHWPAAIRLQSGTGFQENGQLAALTGKDLEFAHTEIVDAANAPAPADYRWQHAMLKWSQMLPELRTTSPWARETIRDAAGRWFMHARIDAATITDTADEAPWHPLEPVSLARLEPRPSDRMDAAAREAMLIRPRFLARLTLMRLRDANRFLYGRKTLAVYAGWAAHVMHEELHLDREALEAVTFAIEQAPEEELTELLKLKKTLAR